MGFSRLPGGTRFPRLIALIAVLAFLPGCGGGTEAEERIKVAGVFTSSVDEPWAAALQQALEKGERDSEIAYDFVQKVPPDEAPRIAREYAQRGYQAVFGEAFACEEEMRRAAADFPEVAFCFGSRGGPTEPNFSVLDAYVHEPAYLCGLLAGKIAGSGTIGAVAGLSTPGVERTINAFRRGLGESAPSARLLIARLEQRYDPAAAELAARRLIEQGAEIVFGEAYGVFPACRRARVMALGNLLDQYSLAPETVVTGPVWDPWPLIESVLRGVRNQSYRAEDLSSACLMARGGARLAPYHTFDLKISAEIRESIEEKRREIVSGAFRVPIDETVRPSD
jgi:basic membrane lipoprotein Med (substrate-binding protein (PBP1-ABC) superfamily)